MIDPVSASLDAILHQNIAQLPIVILAGIITSVGPCVAPRYIAIGALLDGRRNRAVVVGAFIAGMILAYAAIGLGVGILTTLAVHLDVVYSVLATVLVVGGIMTLARRSPTCEKHAHDSPRVRRLSGVFSLGAASALVVSPCCAPVVAAVAGMGLADRNPLLSAAFLCAFALGHALPLCLAGLVHSAVTTRLRSWNAGPALSVVSGTLMMALGLYYGCLA